MGTFGRPYQGKSLRDYTIQETNVRGLLGEGRPSQSGGMKSRDRQPERPGDREDEQGRENDLGWSGPLRGYTLLCNS